MATLTISLPNQVVEMIDTELVRGSFSTRSEFFRDLLRRHFSGKLVLEKYEAKPLEEVRFELTKSGKYSEKFIDSVIAGLKKSSVYEN